MMAMKKNMAIIAVLVISFVTSYILCGTEQNDAGIDSIEIEEYTAVLENKVSFDSVAGTYCGVLPSNVETTLTLNAYGTYLLARTFKEKQNEQEKCGSAYGDLVLSHLAMCGKLFSAIPMSSATSILLSDSVLSSWIESSFRTPDEMLHKVTFSYYCTARFGPSI